MKKCNTAVASLKEIVEDKVRAFEFKRYEVSEYIELERKIERVTKIRDAAITIIQKNA